MIGVSSIVTHEVPMTQEKVSPLHQRMIPFRDKAQKARIRALKDFTTFPDRLPDTVTPDDLRAY